LKNTTSFLKDASFLRLDVLNLEKMGWIAEISWAREQQGRGFGPQSVD
jgi:hypothetical protein